MSAARTAMIESRKERILESGSPAQLRGEILKKLPSVPILPVAALGAADTRKELDDAGLASRGNNLQMRLNAPQADMSPALSPMPRALSQMPQTLSQMDDAQREKLLLDHLPQVHYIARRIHGRLPPHVPLEDLVHDGVLGLMDAVKKI